MTILIPTKKALLDKRFDEAIKNEAVNSHGGTLTGLEIYKQVKNGNIVIDPFNPDQINPNSYNLRLGRELKIYNTMPLDFKHQNYTIPIEIPDKGLALQPGILYLGTTVERVYTNKFKPCINGRSSGGRLGIDIHKCAGFGDVGFNGQWTLEIEVIHPTIVYPDLEIAQISFDTVVGDTSYNYEFSGRYQNQKGTTPSMAEKPKKASFTDFYIDYVLRRQFEALINRKDTVNAAVYKFGNYHYLEFGCVYDISFDPYENETVNNETNEIIDENGKAVGYKYHVGTPSYDYHVTPDMETIYVRKLID